MRVRRRWARQRVVCAAPCLFDAVVGVHVCTPEQRAQLRHAQRVQPVRHVSAGDALGGGAHSPLDRPASATSGSPSSQQWRARRQMRWMWGCLPWRRRRRRRPRGRSPPQGGGRLGSASARAPARRATAAAARSARRRRRRRMCAPTRWGRLRSSATPGVSRAQQPICLGGGVPGIRPCLTPSGLRSYHCHDCRLFFQKAFEATGRADLDPASGAVMSCCTKVCPLAPTLCPPSAPDCPCVLPPA